MFPTWQVQLGYAPSYELSEAQQNIAHDKILVSITHMPKWAGTLIIVAIIISIITFLKIKTDLISFSGIGGFIISIIGVVIVLGVGLIIVSQLHQEVGIGPDLSCEDCGTAYNATSAIITQLGTIPNWIGIIITVSLAFIVLGYFYNNAAF